MVIANAPLVGPARLVVLNAIRLETPRFAGYQLVDVSIGQAQVSASDRHIGSEERASVEDVFPICERLQAIRIPQFGDR